MLTRMTGEEWALVLDLFRACRSRRGDKGRDNRRFLAALHYFFAVHNLTWRALPAEFGNWNSVWKRFWRLSRAGVFEAFFEALAGLSRTAHLVQMFDSTVVRAHVSAAGAKGGRAVRHSAARAGASRPRSTSRSISTACRSPSISPRVRRVTAARSKSCSTSGRTSRPAPRWPTRATMPRGTVPRRASGASAR